MKLGFIGLGNLGFPIAENLLKNRGQLYVYNRTASKATPLVENGAIACSSVKELCSFCDIVFTIVSNDQALREITEGAEGIAANMKKGGVHISISTILPATAKELASLHKEKGSEYIASPVMGRPEAARAGKLHYLVSGPATIIETIKPFLLQAGGAGVWPVGTEAEQASVAKLCSNFLIASAIESMAEGIQLAKKSGLDAEVWMSMLNQTLLNSPVYINYSKILMQEVFEPAAFSLKLGLKDMNLVMQQAAAVQAKMPFGAVIRQQLTNCMEKGLGEHDWTVVAMELK